MASITRRKSGFQAQVRHKGYPTTSKIFASKKEALVWARYIESEMDRGIFVSRKEADSTTLAEALGRYRIEITPKKKGADREHYKINSWLSRPLSKRFLSNIRGIDVAKYRDERLKVASSATVRIELALLSHLYTIAIKEWGMEGLTNPVSLVCFPKPAKGRSRRIGVESSSKQNEIETLISSTKSKELPTIIRLAIETAMRLGEIVSLKWDQIDIEHRLVSLSDTKNGSSRFVPLTSKAIEIISSLPKANERLFSINSRSATLTFIRVRNAARKQYELSGGTDPNFLKDIHFHDLRHEAITRLFEKGFNVMEVGSISGHKTLQMLQRYTHLRAESFLERLG